MQVAAVGARPPAEVARAGARSARRAKLSAQNIAFSAVARRGDHARSRICQGGGYLDGPRRPDSGLATARMLAHITYLSTESMRRKFDRARRDAEASPMTFAGDFEVEHYLDHQGESFRAALRRAHLPLPEPHDGLLRSVRRSGARPATRRAASARAFCRSPSTPTGASAASTRAALADALRARRRRRRATSRSSHRGGTTRSCSTYPEYHAALARFLQA